VREIGTQLFAWYLVVQLCGLVALPLTLRLFANLPDRGYAFAKSLGIFLVGLLFWLGYSSMPVILMRVILASTFLVLVAESSGAMC